MVCVKSLFGDLPPLSPEPKTGPYFVIKASAYFAGFVRYGRARRMVLWTRDRSGAFGFDEIDRPLAQAIIVAIGCGRIVRVVARKAGTAPAPAPVVEMTDAEAWAWFGVQNISWRLRPTVRLGEPWRCEREGGTVGGYGATPCDAIRAARRASEGA